MSVLNTEAALEVALKAVGVTDGAKLPLALHAEIRIAELEQLRQSYEARYTRRMMTRNECDDSVLAVPANLMLRARPVPGLSRLLLRSGLVTGVDGRAEPNSARSWPRSALRSTSPSGSERSRAITPLVGYSPVADDDGASSDSVWPTASQIAAALAHPFDSKVSDPVTAVHNGRLDGADDGSGTDSMWPSAAQIAAALSQQCGIDLEHISAPVCRGLTLDDQSSQWTTPAASPKRSLQPSFWMKTGLAVKQGGFYPSWKRRLFVLDGRALRYFRPSDRAERGAISLGLISRVLEVGEEIHVVTSQRTFKFVADDCDNCSWVQAIEHNRRVLKGASRSQSSQ
jgi:hypothetical protein